MALGRSPPPIFELWGLDKAEIMFTHGRAVERDVEIMAGKLAGVATHYTLTTGGEGIKEESAFDPKCLQKIPP